MTLAGLIQPCGPIADAAAARRAYGRLADAARAGDWTALLEQAWPALAPVFAASPYLAGLAVSSPERLRRLLEQTCEDSLDDALTQTAEAAAAADAASGARALRRLKKDVHLLCALADLGGVWNLDQVTGALSRFADAAVAAALALAAAQETAAGRLAPVEPGPAGPAPGMFCLAMGKHGGAELNYSSDIDISIFYEPELLPVVGGAETHEVAERLAKALSRLLQERTADGYVFRVDLRLRPDPSATPAAVPAAAAFEYYQSVGQNWERAAFIKARPCAGDLGAASAFLDELRPFVWRRSLDYEAIADVHAIKRQIHVHKADERLTAPGANLKLGAGGIREIEFYVQTQQLILGGRDPSLRSRRTLEALQALVEAGHVEPEAAADLSRAYRDLRGVEHRIQMLDDEQTHVLPENRAARARVAALSGYGQLRAFDAWVSRILRTVNRRYGELFPGEETLSSAFGSLVFTGVEDDPATLATLANMGFSHPAQVSSTIMAWHHGRIPATRTSRGRELFTRLAPRLLDAAHATGAPDAAFARFAQFFSSLSGGVQVQAMLLAEPQLLDLVVQVLALAPRLAGALARRPAVMDSLIEDSFFTSLDETAGETALRAAAARAEGFEEVMDAVRRVHREQAFRIGVHVLRGEAKAAAAGRANAELADICIDILADAALKETTRRAGAFPGEAAVVALGKCGGREMTARSDLDLMTLYEAQDPAAMSAAKGWGAETFFARFTQRLVSGLSAPTAEGELYEVDLRLRPSGAAGPVAVSMGAFESYYAAEAETWEFMSMTRARVVWATSPAFAERTAQAIEAVLRRPRNAARTAGDVRAMRRLLQAEKPAGGPWDLKHTKGGLIDIEFAAQYLQLVHGAGGGPLRINTGEALEALHAARLAPARAVSALRSAWVLQQNLSQVLRLALETRSDPSGEPEGLRRLLARAGRAASFEALRERLAQNQRAARAAYERLLD